MADFWTSSWGRVVRQLGVYAAGTIPFVGAFASVFVKALDAETFRRQQKSVAPAPPPVPVVVPVRPPPAPIVRIKAGPGPPAAGLVPFGKTNDLQSVSPGLGGYVAIGAAILVVVALLILRRRKG